MCLVLNFNLKLSSVCFIYRICAQLSTAIYSMTLSNFQEKTRATSALFSCQALTKSASLQPSYSKEQSFDTIVTSSAFNIFAKKKKKSRHYDRFQEMLENEHKSQHSKKYRAYLESNRVGNQPYLNLSFHLPFLCIRLC